MIYSEQTQGLRAIVSWITKNPAYIEETTPPIVLEELRAWAHEPDVESKFIYDRKQKKLVLNLNFSYLKHRNIQQISWWTLKQPIRTWV
jgi:hypothetical protein